MTKRALQAKREWMSRPQFMQSIPLGILGEVCSEGITSEEMLAIFSSIANDLQLAQESYQRAFADLARAIALEGVK